MPPTANHPPATDPLVASEVRQLWWFLDGAIMHADTRIELRRAWGFCARHTWALALVESELRGGVLFRDLGALRRPRRRRGTRMRRNASALADSSPGRGRQVPDLPSRGPLQR